MAVSDENHILALRVDAPRYLSNVPCKHHGPNIERYTKNKGCVLCARQASSRQYVRGVGKIRDFKVRIHEDDAGLVMSFAQQLLQNRGFKK